MTPFTIRIAQICPNRDDSNATIVLTSFPIGGILLIFLISKYSKGEVLEYSEIMDLLLDNIKKIVFPEDWLNLDLTLSKQEFFTLMLINREREIIMSQIADYVNIPMSTATGIIDRLVKNGYCTRRRSESDRRVVMIALTEKAEEIIRDIKNTGSEYFDRVMEALTNEEQHFLFSIITKVIKLLSNEEAPAIGERKKVKNEGIQNIEIQ
jgi:MarR family transcriptional regulator, organic hydroperoxide resistance regulator